MGQCLVINEDMMSAATALGACGIAFFLRTIRAASQGGVEIGFHAHDALVIAAQTAFGAAKLLIANGTHPEEEIDFEKRSFRIRKRRNAPARMNSFRRGLSR